MHLITLPTHSRRLKLRYKADCFLTLSLFVSLCLSGTFTQAAECVTLSRRRRRDSEEGLEQDVGRLPMAVPEETEKGEVTSVEEGHDVTRH